MNALNKHAYSWASLNARSPQHNDQIAYAAMHALRHAYSWALPKTKSP